VYFKHELVIVKLPLAYAAAEAFKELIHNKGLPTSRVTP
jgi:hypothetical protein